MNQEIEEKLKINTLAGQYVVQLLAALINDEPVPQLPCYLTWQQVYETAKMHSVDSMVFCAAKEQILSQPELYEVWNHKRRFNLIQSMTQIREHDRIIEALNAEGIRTLPVKGCIMKSLYPQADWRQMCDLDILIDEGNMEHASEIMQELGYDLHDCSEKDISFSCLPYMLVELHYKLFEKKRAVFAAYYEHIWELALSNQNGSNCFSLKPEDEYIYHLAHFNKHYSEVCGTGIRSIMDVAMFFRRYGGEWDTAYINGELNKLNLLPVADCAQKLAEHWFGTKEQCEEDLSQPEQDMARIVFCSGTYGNILSRIVRDVGQKNASEFGKAKFAMKRAFLPISYMKHDYPVLDKWPVFYPCCFVHRLIRHRKQMAFELKMIFDK